MRTRFSTRNRWRLPLGGVARSLAVVGGATALGQGAIVLAAPVLARLYDPRDFGVLSVYAALLGVMLAIASLRFDFAIPLAADPEEAVHLLILSIVLAFAASIALALVVLVWGEPLSGALGAPALAPFIQLLPIALLVASAAQALSSWAVYDRSFSALARMKAAQGTGQAACQTALGLIQAGPAGLIVGDIAGRVLGMGRLLRSVLAVVPSMKLSARAMGRIGHERWGFARVMTAASLLNALSLQVPFLLIPALFDLESSGQYFLAYRLLILPASLVAAAVSQVFFGEASFRRADPSKLHDLARNVAVSLFVFSIPTYGIMLVGGRSLIEVVLGHDWRLAGEYAQITAPSLVFWSVASPISTLLLVGRRERESLAFTAGELGLKAGALGVGAALQSLTAGIVAMSAVSILIEVAALWRFLRVASVRLSELRRPVGIVVAATMPSMILVLLADRVVPDGILLACAIGWALAFALAAYLTPELKALLTGSHD